MAELMNLGAENNYNKRFRLTRQSFLVSLVPLRMVHTYHGDTEARRRAQIW
jgi:hypothetical protein